MPYEISNLAYLEIFKLVSKAALIPVQSVFQRTMLFPATPDRYNDGSPLEASSKGRQDREIIPEEGQGR